MHVFENCINGKCGTFESATKGKKQYFPPESSNVDIYDLVDISDLVDIVDISDLVDIVDIYNLVDIL